VRVIALRLDSRDARIQDGHLVPELDVEDEEVETRTL